MNTWFVGSHPVGHLVTLNSSAKPSQSGKDTGKDAMSEAVVVQGDKTFFMKARIMAGQADITGNELNVEDFKWLAKDEIQKVVHPYYWSKVKNMLVEQ